MPNVNSNLKIGWWSQPLLGRNGEFCVAVGAVTRNDTGLSWLNTLAVNLSWPSSQHELYVSFSGPASEMTDIVSGGALNSTHSLSFSKSNPYWLKALWRGWAPCQQTSLSSKACVGIHIYSDITLCRPLTRWTKHMQAEYHPTIWLPSSNLQQKHS